MGSTTSTLTPTHGPDPAGASPPPNAAGTGRRGRTRTPPGDPKRTRAWPPFSTSSPQPACASARTLLHVEDLTSPRHDHVLGKADRRRTILLDDPQHQARLRRYLKSTDTTARAAFRAEKNGTGGALSYQLRPSDADTAPKWALTPALHQLERTPPSLSTMASVSRCILKRLGDKNLQTTLRYAEQRDQPPRPNGGDANKLGANLDAWACLAPPDLLQRQEERRRSDTASRAHVSRRARVLRGSSARPSRQGQHLSCLCTSDFGEW